MKKLTRIYQGVYPAFATFSDSLFTMYNSNFRAEFGSNYGGLQVGFNSGPINFFSSGTLQIVYPGSTKLTFVYRDEVGIVHQR
jgi:hypothetical protein